MQKGNFPQESEENFHKNLIWKIFRVLDERFYGVNYASFWGILEVLKFSSPLTCSLVY